MSRMRRIIDDLNESVLKRRLRETEILCLDSLSKKNRLLEGLRPFHCLSISRPTTNLNGNIILIQGCLVSHSEVNSLRLRRLHLNLSESLLHFNLQFFYLVVLIIHHNRQMEGVSESEKVGEVVLSLSLSSSLTCS